MIEQIEPVTSVVLSIDQTPGAEERQVPTLVLACMPIAKSHAVSVKAEPLKSSSMAKRRLVTWMTSLAAVALIERLKMVKRFNPSACYVDI